MPSIEELQRKAARYFQERPPNFPQGRPFNCCESVLLALKEDLDTDSDLIPRIATGIRAGYSLNGLTCGSISGPALVIGLRYGRNSSQESPKMAWDKTHAYIKAFKERDGAPSPAGNSRAWVSRAIKTCRNTTPAYILRLRRTHQVCHRRDREAVGDVRGSSEQRSFECLDRFEHQIDHGAHTHQH